MFFVLLLYLLHFPSVCFSLASNSKPQRIVLSVVTLCEIQLKSKKHDFKYNPMTIRNPIDHQHPSHPYHPKYHTPSILTYPSPLPTTIESKLET